MPDLKAEPVTASIPEVTPVAGKVPPASEEGAKPETVTLTVGKETRQVTQSELVDLASKAAGAESKFEEAASMRKEAERGIRIGSLIKTLEDDPTDADIRELAGLLDVNPGAFMAQLKEDDKGGTPADGKPAEGAAAPKIDKDTIAAAMTEMGLPPAEVKARMDSSFNRDVAEARKEIRKSSDIAVQTDEVFGKIAVGDKKDDRLEVIKEMVAEDVLKRITDGEPFGADLVSSSVQKIRSRLTKMGIPDTSGANPIALGLLPGGGVLPAAVNSDEPIARVSSADDEDDSNIISRYMQKARQRLASK